MEECEKEEYIKDLIKYSKFIEEYFYNIFDEKDYGFSISSLNHAVYKIIFRANHGDIVKTREDCEFFHKGFIEMLKVSEKLENEKKNKQEIDQGGT